MEDLKLSKIQFKRGPSNKLDLVSKYNYEPIVLTDLEELLIWRENQSPIRFKSYPGYLELDKLEEDFEDEEILGKVWADYKGVIKFGTLIDSKISIISIDDLVNSTVLNSELNEFKNKIIDELSTDDNIIVNKSSKSSKLDPGCKISLNSPDLNSTTHSNFTGDVDYIIDVDLSPHTEKVASSSEYGHIKLSPDLKLNDQNQLIINPKILENIKKEADPVPLILALS